MSESILVQFIIVLASSTVVATLCHSIHIPTIVGFIVAGIFIGPYALQWVPSLPGAEALSEIAIVFLMFTLGLEFSFQTIKHLRRAFFGIGGVQVISTALITAVLAQFLFVDSWPKSIFIGFLITLSSTAIVMKLLEDSRETASPYGQCSIGVLLFQDIAVIPMMFLVPLLAGASSGVAWDIKYILIWAAKLCLIMGVMVVGSRSIIPFLLARVIRTRSRELFFFAILSLCFGIALGVEHLGLSLSLGAFIAGMMISETPYVKQIVADFIHMRDNFLGLFFTSVGMLLDPAFVATHLFWIAVLVISLIGLKAGIVYLAVRWNRFPTSVAAITALTVCQIGEFSFVLAQTGAPLGLLTPLELQYFISASIMSMIATPFLFRLAPKLFLGTDPDHFGAGLLSLGNSRKQTKQAIEKSDVGPKSHTVIIGFGPVGQDVGRSLKALDIPFKVIEMNHDIVKRAKKEGIDIYYGDASRNEILETVGIQSARLVVVAVAGLRMTQAALATVRQLRPDIRVLIRTQYLRELEQLDLRNTDEVVVAEFETSIEVLARTLRLYSITEEQIHRFIVDLRKGLAQRSPQRWDTARQFIELPSWEALSLIRPVKLEENSPAVKQTLLSLQLRQHTGATVVCVHREGMGTTVPGADFVFEKNDMVHLIGSDSSIDAAIEIMSGAKPVTIDSHAP